MSVIDADYRVSIEQLQSLCERATIADVELTTIIASKDDTRVFRQFSDRSQVLLPCERVEP